MAGVGVGDELRERRSKKEEVDAAGEVETDNLGIEENGGLSTTMQFSG